MCVSIGVKFVGKFIFVLFIFVIYMVNVGLIVVVIRFLKLLVMRIVRIVGGCMSLLIFRGMEFCMIMVCWLYILKFVIDKFKVFC